MLIAGISRCAGAVFVWVAACSAAAAVEPRFAPIGSAGCADCHGAATSRSTDVWKRSYWLWSETDRHRRAFETLFAPRSVAIVRRLLDADAIVQSDGQPDARDRIEKTLSDEAAYLNVLEARCIGCHATTPPGEARRAKDYAAGVSCESCHGAAQRWQAAHHGSEWSKLTPRAKLEQFGFAPVRSPAARAAVCVDCHVGPRREGSRTFDVDHDLIAAGHPRLSFEFTSAFARLAPHWDASRGLNAPHDEARNGTNFDAWRHGQAHVARALVALQDADVARHGRVDFARVDCFACHHRLRGDQAAAPPLRSLDAAALRETPAGLFGAQTLAGDKPLATWLAAGRFPWEPPAAAAPPASHDSPVEILAAMTDALARPESRRWDRLVAFDLALRAYLADDDPRRPPELADAARRLDDWLAACFDRQRPNRYDSPTKFRPDDPALDDSLAELLRLLRRAPRAAESRR